MLLAKTLAALGLLLSPAGGYHGPYVQGHPAAFRAGAAVATITPPLRGHAPGGDPADCDSTGAFNGPRRSAFEEPYIDAKHDGHYDPGDPYKDCNGNGRWDGNLLGGGADTPRFYDHVADPVTARAMVVAVGQRHFAVEVLDQEGLFDVYQNRIRSRLAADGYRLDGVFISATHDESAPDSLGLGGVDQLTSGVNDYWVDYMVGQAARAIEQADRAVRPARIRYTEVLEPSNVRQCWSSYPFVDDQRIPVLQAVDARGRAIVTLASVSQHAETLGFNGGPQSNWVSSDWIGFFRGALEHQFGGVAIEMAGSVGSVESPEVYAHAISRTPQRFVNASHPAGCRTLFRAGPAGTDVSGTGHVALGYNGETRAFGLDLAVPIVRALRAGAFHWSQSNTLWGERASICIPLQNQLFLLGASLGVFAHKPGYNRDCTVASPVAPNGASAGQSLRSEVAAFRIGDGEFISIPGEAFPFTFLRGFLGPQDMQTPSDPLPPWLMPHMHTPFRFIDGLAEDMLGYLFPSGNAVGIPSATNLGPSDTDRFGCGHSDDSEATSATAADTIGAALVRLLDAHGGAGETVVRGRYVLPGRALSRDPLGGPELKCNLDQTFMAARAPAVAVRLASGRVVQPLRWMSLSGLPQVAPDRDTRGYFDARGRRVWLDVF
ncbi:MAG TPA: hypothetical protein VMU39_21920 [Solirubrobacteraceae bacterium]|nr:hypothetical protein [Solirubrobacteraceae bacterium]